MSAFLKGCRGNFFREKNIATSRCYGNISQAKYYSSPRTPFKKALTKNDKTDLFVRERIDGDFLVGDGALDIPKKANEFPRTKNQPRREVPWGFRLVPKQLS